MNKYVSDFYNGNIKTGGIMILIGLLFLLFFVLPQVFHLPRVFLFMAKSNLTVAILCFLEGSYVIWKAIQSKKGFLGLGFNKGADKMKWEERMVQLTQRSRIMAWLMSILILICLFSLFSKYGIRTAAIAVPLILFFGIFYCMIMLSKFRIEQYIRKINKDQ